MKDLFIINYLPPGRNPAMRRTNHLYVLKWPQFRRS